MPKFSVIIPSYNQKHYIKDTIDSILNQTNRDFEVIVVDNHSNDGTQSILDSYCDQRLKIIYTNNEGVIARSRNLGAHHSKGEWLTFCDSDDLFDNMKLDYLSNCIAKHKFDLCYHRMRIIGENNHNIGRRYLRTYKLSQEPLRDLLLKENPIATSSVCVRKELYTSLSGMPEDKKLIAAEDYRFWLRMAQNGARFHFINKTLGMYRVHPNSQSGKNMSTVVYLAKKPFLKHLTKNEKRLSRSNTIYYRIKYYASRYQMYNSLLMILSGGSVKIKIKTIVHWVILKFWGLNKH